MKRVQEILIGVVLLGLLVAAAVFGLRYYGRVQYSSGRDAGYAVAVAAGKAQHDRDAAAAVKTEADLRTQLATRDADAHRKEVEYAENLDAAQRRVRAGTDRLRCPAGPIPVTAATSDRPAAGGSPADGQGLAVVPDVAADILGLAADHQRLLRNYERVVERFEACRAVNAGP